MGYEVFIYNFFVFSILENKMKHFETVVNFLHLLINIKKSIKNLLF